MSSLTEALRHAESSAYEKAHAFEALAPQIEAHRQPAGQCGAYDAGRVMSDKIRPRVPAWLITRSSDFNGIWIPDVVPLPSSLPPIEAGALFGGEPKALAPFSYEPKWRLVCDLFKAHDLDPADPHHWQKLLLNFAKEHAASQPGANRIWTEARLCRLDADFVMTQSAHPGKSDTDICKLLVKGIPQIPGDAYAKALPALYTKQKWQALRRLLPEAHERLAELVAVLVQLVRADFDTWTADREAGVKDWAVRRVALGGHPGASCFYFLDKLRDELRENPPEPSRAHSTPAAVRGRRNHNYADRTINLADRAPQSESYPQIGRIPLAKVPH